MDRRQFLLASAVTTLGGTPALAQMKMDDMLGMDMGHAMKPMPKGALALQEGAPLQTLSRLANRSVEPGLFEATLPAEPASVEFVKGLSSPVLAYNGTIPGPLIEATEGDRWRERGRRSGQCARRE